MRSRIATTRLAVLAAVLTASLGAQARPRPQQDEFVAQVRELVQLDLLGSIDAKQWAALGLNALETNRHKDAVGFFTKVYQEIGDSSKVSAKAKCLIAAIIGVHYARQGDYGVVRSRARGSRSSAYWLGLAENHMNEDTKDRVLPVGVYDPI